MRRQMITMTGTRIAAPAIFGSLSVFIDSISIVKGCQGSLFLPLSFFGSFESRLIILWKPNCQGERRRRFSFFSCSKPHKCLLWRKDGCFTYSVGDHFFLDAQSKFMAYGKDDSGALRSLIGNLVKVEGGPAAVIGDERRQKTTGQL